MSKSMLLKILPVFVVMSLLGGCLTALRPFYLSGQVTQDNRLLGTYRDEKAGHVWKIGRDDEYSSRYVATLSQQGAWSKYLLTLFKFKDRTYLDIFPGEDSSLVRDPGGPPTMSQFMRGLTSQPLHLLVEVEVAEAQLTLGVVSRQGLKELAKVRPNLRLLGEDGVIPAPYPTKELQTLLGEIGGNERIFDEKVVLVKDPATISKLINSYCPACSYSFPVMSADTEDRGESWRVRCPACGYEYPQAKNVPGAESGSAGEMKLLQGSTIIRTTPQ